MKKIISFVLSLALLLTCFTTAIPTHSSAANTVYLGFTSDIHGRTDHLDTWLSLLETKGISLSSLTFGGDYADTYSTENMQAVMNTVTSHPAVTKTIYTMGNHEYTGDGSSKSFASLTGCTRTGVKVSTSTYAIYTIGAASSQQSFNTADIQALKTWLKKTATKKTVFLVSHYPLHYLGSSHHARYTKNAGKMISLLNKYKNVVFLWGHNHTVQDDSYGTVKKSGAQIQYTKNSSKKIKFTYASMGCIKDGASHEIYGLSVKLKSTSAKANLTFEYESLKDTTVTKTVILKRS